MLNTSSQEKSEKILIVGLGSTLLGDEGIGVRIIELLQEKAKLPPGITLLDGGTAGYTLIDCMKDYKRVILIDAVKGGGNPGSIYYFSFDDIMRKPELKLSGHQIDLPEVLMLAKKLGELPEMTLIGIEPENIDYGMKLSLTAKEAAKQVIENLGDLLP